MKKTGKSILYLTIIILSIVIFILIGIIINILNTNKKIQKQEGSETLQLGETTSDNAYVDINTHLSEVNDATKVDESVAAIADSISEGKQAWINGKLITGNGADNITYRNLGYNEGYTDGQASSSANASIEYTYHSCSSSCYSACGGSRTVYSYVIGSETYHGVACSKCGQKDGGYSKILKAQEAAKSPCSKQIKICGKVDGVTVESATIVFK